MVVQSDVKSGSREIWRYECR